MNLASGRNPSAESGPSEVEGGEVGTEGNRPKGSGDKGIMEVLDNAGFCNERGTISGYVASWPSISRLLALDSSDSMSRIPESAFE